MAPEILMGFTSEETFRSARSHTDPVMGAQSKDPCDSVLWPQLFG